MGTSGGPGVYGGNQFVIPLVGGSGGGGEYNGSNNGVLGAGGGAGGGALMIASTTRIVVNGTINANGGNQGQAVFRCNSGGSGEAIRLVSNAISRSGTLTAHGGGATGQCQNAGAPPPSEKAVSRAEGMLILAPELLN